MSAVSEQSLGLSDLFVGQIGASYTDLVFLLGIGGLVVSGKTAFVPSDAEGDQREPAEADTGKTAGAGG